MSKLRGKNGGKPLDPKRYTISHNLVFGEVFTDPDLCIPLLEEILNIRIKDLIYKDTEKHLKDDPRKGSVRLDLFVMDSEGRTYDIEMQNADRGDLLKRSRFYQARMDTRTHEKGRDMSGASRRIAEIPIHADRTHQTQKA